MKKIKLYLIPLMAALFFANTDISASASSDIKMFRINATPKGQVIVEKDESIDNNAYILNQAAPAEQYNVIQSAATTFTTNDYSKGFFDSPNVAYTTRGFSNFAAVIDNNLNTSSTGNSEIIFSEPIEITGFYRNDYNALLTIYDENGKALYDQGAMGANNNYYRKLEGKVKRIVFASLTGLTVREFDLFVARKIDYITVSDLNLNTKDVSTTVKYGNPKSEDWTLNQILLNDVVIIDNTKDTTIELNDLQPETEYKLTVRSYYSDGKYIDAIRTFKTTVDKTPPANVKNLKATQVNESFKLTYEMPTDSDFSHVIIYRDYTVLEKKFTEVEYVDEGAAKNTRITYRVITVDTKGNKSSGAAVSIDYVGTKVSNVKAIAKDYTAVNLTWNNPKREDLETVTIYRKDPQNITEMMRSLFNSDDGYEPLFQTNGTVFKDMSVKADTNYSYKLNTVIAGEEHDGVIVDVKTPKISAVGTDTTKTENGDYLVSWSQPTIGQMKILVDNKEYLIVNASDLQYTIPKQDMKYDFVGNPLIKLVPISEDGTEGIAVDVGKGPNIDSNVKMPEELSGNNLLKAAVALLSLVAGFVLLRLAFLTVPKVVMIIRNSLSSENGKRKLERRSD